MASITYGWDLETVLQAFGISTKFADQRLCSSVNEYIQYREKLASAIESLAPILEKYPPIEVYLMCIQDSEINLMESKMVGVSSMIGGLVPELFWSLAPNVAVNDPLPNHGFDSLIRFYLDAKSQDVMLPAPTIHFSGWHAEKLELPKESIWLHE
tara:strand:- start:524 stop:988 length:465 start_codon:yes stop_codon:yes gene_type:complete